MLQKRKERKKKRRKKEKKKEKGKKKKKEKKSVSKLENHATARIRTEALPARGWPITG